MCMSRNIKEQVRACEAFVGGAQCARLIGLIVPDQLFEGPRRIVLLGYFDGATAVQQPSEGGRVDYRAARGELFDQTRECTLDAPFAAACAVVQGELHGWK